LGSPTTPLHMVKGEVTRKKRPPVAEGRIEREIPFEYGTNFVRLASGGRERSLSASMGKRLKPSKAVNQTGESNLLEVLPRLSEKDLKIIKIAMDSCGEPTPERLLPLLKRKRVIAALRKLSRVCGYGTTAVHATLKKLMQFLK
jgi:hypothetical protein